MSDFIEVPPRQKMPECVRDEAATHLLQWVWWQVSDHKHMPTHAEIEESADKFAVISFSRHMCGNSHLQVDLA